MDNLELIALAQHATIPSQSLRASKDAWKYMGYFGAALLTSTGQVYIGVNLELYCGIGFCAEHSAVAAMVEHGETRVNKIAAVTADGVALPPCGRCRELLYQMDSANLDTEVIMNMDGSASKLRHLLPENWQVRLGL